MPPKKRYLLRDLAVYTASSTVTAIKQWNPALFFKDMCYFSQWWKFRKNGHGTLAAKIPWLVFEAIEFLESWLKSDMQVFEYGSGGSTIFFSERVNNIISIEHDPSWFGMVEEYISKKEIKNISYKLLPPVAEPLFAKKSDQLPGDFISHQKQYSGKSFETYAKAIAAYPAASFDLVVIDGRVRASCILEALSKVKLNGTLLLDNADRKQYLTPFPELMDKTKWEKRVFKGHFPFSSASVLNTTMLFKKLG